MTPADELAEAARKLSSGRLIARIDLDIPLAKLLRETAALHTPTTCEKHEGCAPLGCDWCGDEDWPCADIRNALAVAQLINGGEQR
jgi:hypothetical protein